MSLLTFPGVILHEYAHYKMCVWRGIPVKEVVLFQFGTPAGYVRHERPNCYADALAIAGAPFLINSALAVLLGVLLGLLLTATGGSGGVAAAGVGWLGISTGMHAIPSSGDAAYLWALATEHRRTSVLGMLGFPIAALIYVANLLSFLWFDVIYAAALVLLTLRITIGVL